jgi:glycosyltransferase involved in cell wall biosynthesis
MNFSIVIPTRNERQDIDEALTAIAKQTHPPSEVIVVDDSDDDTRDVIERRRGSLPQLRLMAGSGQGRCVARNEGIVAATGDVVIVLNADVILPADFIAKLLTHYENGAGYVLVNAEVANPQAVMAAYIGAQAAVTYADRSKVQWTEGFSCRRDALMAAGMFPVTPMPLVAGEDGYLGERLSQTATRVYDESITVRFIVPADVRTFWRTYQERAYPFTALFLLGHSVHYVVIRNVLKTAWRTACAVTLVPDLVYAARLAKAAPGNTLSNTVAFFGITIFQDLAYVTGDWKGLSKYLSWKRRTSHGSSARSSRFAERS